ncbi:YrzE family protein [uncultured Arthrobacter sp.]|uniref:YrzE family protein n=1 Tax=uncultured Arthrobacter sp. TaxID=114050 RepID=UPI003217996E
MSSPTGPEDLPRRARNDEGTLDRDGRIHDARQDGADDRAELRAERAERAERADDARAFPAAPVAGAAGTAGRDDRPIHGTRDDRYVDETVVDEIPTRETVVAREKEQFGGVKIGSAFFGWLAATGMAVLLTALVAAAGTAVGLATNTNVNEAVNQASQNQSVGIAGIIALLVVLFVSYYCGGYVAGRMARFNGARQGLMVWIWALIAAIVVAILAMTAGQQFNVLANLNSFPRIPVNEGDLTATSMIAAVVVAVVALFGAMLGGLAGMRFHRKVDRAGFTPVETVEER